MSHQHLDLGSGFKVIWNMTERPLPTKPANLSTKRPRPVREAAM